MSWQDAGGQVMQKPKHLICRSTKMFRNCRRKELKWFCIHPELWYMICNYYIVLPNAVFLGDRFYFFFVSMVRYVAQCAAELARMKKRLNSYISLRFIHLPCMYWCIYDHLCNVIMHFFIFQGPRCYHVPCFMESSEYFMKSHEQLDQKNWNLWLLLLVVSWNFETRGLGRAVPHHPWAICEGRNAGPVLGPQRENWDSEKEIFIS